MAKQRVRIKLDFVCEAESDLLGGGNPDIVGACFEAARHLILHNGGTGTLYVEPGARYSIVVNPPKRRAKR